MGQLWKPCWVPARTNIRLRFLVCSSIRIGICWAELETVLVVGQQTAFFLPGPWQWVASPQPLITARADVSCTTESLFVDRPSIHFLYVCPEF